MIRVELSALIGKLNDTSRHALEQSATLSISRHNSEVTVQHFFISLLDNPLSDLRIFLKYVCIEHERIREELSQSLPVEQSLDTYPAFSPLLIELLQDAWLLSTTELQQTELRSGAVFITALMNEGRYLPNNLTSCFESINREQLRKQFVTLTDGSAETAVPEAGKQQSAPHAEVADTALARFTRDLTAQARNGELDPVLCREEEIGLMIDILCRRRKNNPIVVGDAGVGKSAVIEGLAQQIVKGRVPERLQGVSLLLLDLGLLQAGASVKGEFEKRIKAIIEEVKTSPENIILFIDEAHTMVGGGGRQGGDDAANLLKPALARGELCTIGATTWKEYKKYFEKDPALTRRFQLVKLEEPGIDQAVDIMRGLHSVYENAHQVLIQDSALQAAVKLSARYVSGRQLPDKAIDVLDTACARIAINLSSPPRNLVALESRKLQRQMEVDLLQRQLHLGQPVDEKHLQALIVLKDSEEQDYQRIEQDWQAQQSIAQQIIGRRRCLLEIQQTEPGQKEESESLRIEIKNLEEQLVSLCDNGKLVYPEVDAGQIAAVIADWTGVPVDQIGGDELHKITHLPAILGAVLKGQNVAIAKIHQHMLTARADLRRSGRPMGAFLLVGPSGVGKTETVVQIAEQLYGGKQFLTTINMSEYQEKHTVSRLIGSPPGYVGYGEGGVLTEAIRRMPYSIVLLDEVEKAHPDVLNLFYQAFDKGELADGEGRLIDCRNVIFFLTSNLGYQVIVDHREQLDLLDDALYPELAAFFKPALLARMEVVPYLPLPPAVLKQIILGKLQRLKDLLCQRYQAEVDIDDSLVKEICLRANRAENGARMLEAIIDGQMLPPVSLALLNKLAAQEPVRRISLTCVDGEFIGNVS